MARRPKKIFPQGTFIPTPQRLLSIIQLCIAFSLMLWYLFQPFMGEYFALRNRMLVYEYAMGTSDVLKARPDQTAKLERQAKRFIALPEQEKDDSITDYREIQTYAKRSTLQKIGDGIRKFIVGIPPFEQAWIFFSITISILVLLKIEGARQAVWILPLIVAAYAVDNQLEGKRPYVSPDSQLFPTEETIIHQYLNVPLAQNPMEQKKQLEEGWKRYLVDHWSQKNDEEEAEFNFTIARLKLLHTESLDGWLGSFHEKIHPIILACYLLWNLFFAWMISRIGTKQFIDTKSGKIPHSSCNSDTSEIPEKMNAFQSHKSHTRC